MKQDRINQAKKGAHLWAREKKCELYLRIRTGFFDWIMISEKTGIHKITTPSSTKPEPNERVKAHWQGFILNQDR